MFKSLRERLYLGPLRWGWRRWSCAYPRFNTFPANHFIATMERQCAELREIELADKAGLEYSFNALPRTAYVKEFVDCISVATNGLRWALNDDPKAIAAALKARSARYFDPHAIIDTYIEKYGA